jgi:hypothetical protein
MCTVALTWAAPQQAKTIQTTQAALDDDQSSTLPPLMNPAILEASDDLTNLSHLNEPAGTYLPFLKGHGASAADRMLQCCRRLDCDMRRRKSTRILALFSLLPIRLRKSTRSMSMIWCRYTRASRGRRKRHICSLSRKRHLRTHICFEHDGHDLITTQAHAT